MARPISDEELQLKQRARRRLIGAIVLVTAAAVVLPMILDSEPRSFNQNVEIHIPSPDSAEFKPKGAGAGDGKAAPGAQTAPVKPERAASDAKTDAPGAAGSSIAEVLPPSAAVKNEAANEPLAKLGTAEKPQDKQKAVVRERESKESAPQDASRSAAGAYVVQVAALSDTTKAKQLEKQLAGAGLKSYTEVVNTQAGEVTRVRAGPYPTREAAEKARTQIKKAGLDGKVVPR